MDFINPVSNPTGFTIFIFVIIGASFLWRMKWSQGLITGGMKDGVPATAVITGMGQTGVTINEQPQLTFELLVQPPTGGQAYPVSVKQTVPMMAIGMLAPGRTVGVVISPKNPAKVKLDLQGTANIGAAAAAAQFGGGVPAGPAPGIPGIPGVPAAPVTMPPTAQVRSNDELVASGEVVAVTVDNVQETGQSYGADPILLLTVTVHAPTGPYQLQVGHRVPADKRARLQPGTVLRGAMDRAEPGALGIDWRAL